MPCECDDHSAELFAEHNLRCTKQRKAIYSALTHVLGDGECVWLDVFAVRQWPGNSADLDFGARPLSALPHLPLRLPTISKLHTALTYASHIAQSVSSARLMASCSWASTCRRWRR